MDMFSIVVSGKYNYLRCSSSMKYQPTCYARFSLQTLIWRECHADCGMRPTTLHVDLDVITGLPFACSNGGVKRLLLLLSSAVMLSSSVLRTGGDRICQQEPKIQNREPGAQGEKNGEQPRTRSLFFLWFNLLIGNMEVVKINQA